MENKISKNVNIHSTAILEGDIEIGDGVTIGPYSIIRGKIKIGKDNIFHNNVILDGDIEIGDNNEFFSFSVIGTKPQDNKFKGESSKVKIGNNNIIREYVTINGGSEKGNLWKNNQFITTVENNCYFYISSHIAHDCYIESNVTLTNSVAIAGHVLIENNVIIGGLSGVTQFLKIGRYAMISGVSGIKENIPPFTLVQTTNTATWSSGVNLIGLKRNNFSREDILLISGVYKFLSNNKQLQPEDQINFIKNNFKQTESIKKILTFLFKVDI